jgi:hypothetical protein
MDRTHPTPVVPLEAGSGPDNPPCPACGEPLFGWIAAAAGIDGSISRCESCGLGVVGGPGDAREALEELDGDGESGTLRIVNRSSVAAALGSAGWAGLEPGSRYLFSVESVRRLVAVRDQVVTRSRWAPLAGVASMWQTMLNSLTFGRNIAFGALGRGTSAPAKEPWQRRIDGLISIVLAIPALVVAVPLELGGAVMRRGAVVSVQLQLL